MEAARHRSWPEGKVDGRRHTVRVKRMRERVRGGVAAASPSQAVEAKVQQRRSWKEILHEKHGRFGRSAREGFIGRAFIGARDGAGPTLSSNERSKSDAKTLAL